MCFQNIILQTKKIQLATDYYLERRMLTKVNSQKKSITYWKIYMDGNTANNIHHPHWTDQYQTREIKK